jgi:hypothetical protein
LYVTDMRDELLEQVVSELRTLPPVDEAAVRRIVRAAAVAPSEGYTPGDVHGARFAAVRVASWWRSRVPLAAAAGLALAAGLGGFLAGDAVGRRPAVAAVGSALPIPESTAKFASAERVRLAPNFGPLAADRLVPAQFVLNAPRASRVALVGDFNGWDATATPLTRDPSSGIWTTTLELTAGRHVYAFVVDGNKWTLDPRAPKAQDPDFGTPSSVVLVGAP